MKTSRRNFLQTTSRAAVLGTLVSPLAAHAFDFGPGFTAMEFKQDKLAYGYDALEPYIDAKTMELHYSKHHAAYVKNVNEALGSEKTNVKDEKDLFKKIGSMSDKIRNNGGGAWNHNFFWKIMKPNGGNPSGKIAEAINGSFGSFDKFKEQFKKAALDQFGSGWAWLVTDNGKLSIGSTPNQDNPLMGGAKTKGTPVIGLDVWEHAYYLKYQNKRAEYVDTWWNVVNWDEASKNLG